MRRRVGAAPGRRFHAAPERRRRHPRASGGLSGQAVCGKQVPPARTVRSASASAENGCTVSDAPGEAWEVDASPTLDAIREALDEAAAAGFDPGTLKMPKPR